MGGGTNWPQLINYVMLYDAGDECENVTGGWPVQFIYDGVGSTSLKDNYIAFETRRTPDVGGNVTRWTANKVNVDRYSMAACVCEATGNASTSLPDANIILNSNAQSVTGGSSMYYVVRQKMTAKGVKKLCTLGTESIKGLSGGHYVGCGISSYNGNTGSYAGNIHSVAFFRNDNVTELIAITGLPVPESLDALVADTTALKTIFKNERAVRFMTTQCTGDFMCSVIGNSTALELLQQSLYYTLIQANEHWAKFLAMLV